MIDTQISLLPSIKDVLLGYRLPRTIEEARNYLAHRLQSIQFLALYRTYFPEKYVASTQRAFPIDDEAYSPLEAEFLDLVNEHLFPIHLEFMLYAAAPDERSMMIPVRSLGVDWYNLEADDLPAGWHLLLYLAGEIKGEEFFALQPDLQQRADSPLRGMPWPQVSWEDFEAYWKKAAKELHPSVAYLPNALDLVFGETGNILLDSNDEMPIEDCMWTKEHMDLLIAESRDADRIVNNINEFTEWIGSDPDHLAIILSCITEERSTWIKPQPPTTANPD